MKRFRAVIIDDEESARNVMVNLIKQCSSELEVVGLASNLEDGAQIVKNTNPHLVFLDVQMPKHYGYEIAQFFDSINFEIIFATAYDNYAIKAFELSAVDYLVKPINVDRLTEAIEKAIARVSTKDKLHEYQLLEESFKERKINKIIIPELGNRRIVNISDIVAMEADGAYSKIYLTNDEQIIIGKNLKYFEKNLKESTEFVRIHRTWFINKTHVKSMNKTELTVQLNNEIEAKISRSKLDEFSASLN